MVNLDSKITIPPEIVFRVVNGEAVILDTASSKYFGLNEVGTRMWALLSEHATVYQALERLKLEYDVDAEQLEHDLLEFANQMATRGLMEISSAETDRPIPG